MESFGGYEIPVLGLGESDVAGDVIVEGKELLVVNGAHGLIESALEEAGFEAGSAKDGLLGNGHALDGEDFLRILGLIGGDEVVLEAGELFGVFEAHDGVCGGGESVADGVAGGGGFAFWGARSGGMSSVGAVGGKLFGGDGLVGVFHDSRSSTEGGWSLKLAGVK